MFSVLSLLCSRYSLDDLDYPFLVEGQKVTEGEYFDTHYDHKAVAVHCGMDLTAIQVLSTPKESSQAEEKE